VLLGTLAACVEWHMQQGLAPLLFADQESDAADRLRPLSLLRRMEWCWFCRQRFP
jgi:hypothetical protein